MGKDHLREYLAVAVEAYDLAATPQPQRIFLETIDECEPLICPRMPTTNRKILLDLSIDIKRIYDKFIGNLARVYGPSRAERFTTWVKVGYIEQFHSDHRLQIKWDRKVLNREIMKYRHTKRG